MKFFHKKKAANLSIALVVLAICGVATLAATYALHNNQPIRILESFSTVRLKSSDASFVIPNGWSVASEKTDDAYVEKIIVTRGENVAASVSVIEEAHTPVITRMYEHKTADEPITIRGIRIFPRSAESAESDPDVYLFNADGYTYVCVGDGKILDQIWSTWGLALE